MNNVPKNLINQIREKRVVLFLGSGASIGAVHPDNKKPPIGNELGKFYTENIRPNTLLYAKAKGGLFMKSSASTSTAVLALEIEQ